MLDELGFDAAFNYLETPPDQSLRQAAPGGIDIYSDNVGGDHLQAAINTMKPSGRIPLCGMISTYNAVTPPPGPTNLMLMVGKRLTMRGFLVGGHADRKATFRTDVGGYVHDGRIRVQETVVDGMVLHQQTVVGGWKLHIELDLGEWFPIWRNLAHDLPH